MASRGLALIPKITTLTCGAENVMLRNCAEKRRREYTMKEMGFVINKT